jgi:hypothetical protein
MGSKRKEKGAAEEADMSKSTTMKKGPARGDSCVRLKKNLHFLRGRGGWAEEEGEMLGGGVKATEGGGRRVEDRGRKGGREGKSVGGCGGGRGGEIRGKNGASGGGGCGGYSV